MSRFITRVELHNTQHGNGFYDALHIYMEMEGFKRTIQGDNGLVYHMPPAEYQIQGNYTMQEVRAKAVNAATRTGKTCAVLVSEYLQACWIGLPFAGK